MRPAVAGREAALGGCLLGMMIGDSIGLPFENISRRRVTKMLAARPLGHRLLVLPWGRYGLVSDDSEHAAITTHAYFASVDETGVADPVRFGRALASGLKRWILGVPPAAGMATAKACIKLLAGFSFEKSGVRSAGNGPLMRSLPLGVVCESVDELAAFVRVSTRVTHTDERAEHAAMAIALAGRVSSRNDAAEVAVAYRNAVESALPSGQVKDVILRAIESVGTGENTASFADRLGLGRGISGFVMHTAPAVIHAWLAHPLDARAAIDAVVRLGGDTDTTGALVGGLVGARIGEAALPSDWLNGISDWPCSLGRVRALAASESDPKAAAGVFGGGRWLIMPLRSLVLLAIVLVHVVRRALPPY
jgi:ADP-ribosyl-[dinitrogen reductase] hydrolase